MRPSGWPNLGLASACKHPLIRLREEREVRARCEVSHWEPVSLEIRTNA